MSSNNYLKTSLASFILAHFFKPASTLLVSEIVNNSNIFFLLEILRKQMVQKNDLFAVYIIEEGTSLANIVFETFQMPHFPSEKFKS